MDYAPTVLVENSDTLTDACGAGLPAWGLNHRKHRMTQKKDACKSTACIWVFHGGARQPAALPLNHGAYTVNSEHTPTMPCEQQLIATFGLFCSPTNSHNLKLAIFRGGRQPHKNCFNSRPSCDGRRIRTDEFATVAVSIHARRVTGDGSRLQELQRDAGFNSRPSCDGRLEPNQ